MAAPVKSRHLLDSFRFAVDGLVHVLHVDWHLRYILLAGALVLVGSTFFRLTRVEILWLVLALTLVVTTELFNRAIEAVVDLVTPEFQPLAKVAKDVAAAAVLVSIIAGLIMVAGVFTHEDVLSRVRGTGERPPPHILHVLMVGAITVLIAVLLAKVWEGHWQLTRGGMVSAHSAVAFFCFVSVCFLTTDVLVWVMALVPAVLVAQSRVETGAHSVREVLIGVVVALVVGGGLYGFLAMRGGG
jgi:diacylglycerol kinase (ATP)